MAAQSTLPGLTVRPYGSMIFATLRADDTFLVALTRSTVGEFSLSVAETTVASSRLARRSAAAAFCFSLLRLARRPADAMATRDCQCGRLATQACVDPPVRCWACTFGRRYAPEWAGRPAPASVATPTSPRPPLRPLGLLPTPSPRQAAPLHRSAPNRSNSTAVHSTLSPLFRRPVPQRSQFSHRIRPQRVSRPFKQINRRKRLLSLAIEMTGRGITHSSTLPPTSSCAQAVSVHPQHLPQTRCPPTPTKHASSRTHHPHTASAPTHHTRLPTTVPQLVAKCRAKPSRAERSLALASPPPGLSRAAKRKTPVTDCVDSIDSLCGRTADSVISPSHSARTHWYR